MKNNKFTVLMICLILSFLTACASQKEVSDEEYIKQTPAGQYFTGSYKIRKIAERSTSKSKFDTSGTFIFGTGKVHIHEESKTESNVTFAWEKDGQYMISSFPFNKIRVKLDPNIKNPEASFRIDKFNSPDGYSCISDAFGDVFSREGPDYLINMGCVSAVIIVRPEDWPMEINMPLNGDQ